MEGFEHIVKVALETENLIVAPNLKFFVPRQTKKQSVEEWQTHGYEVAVSRSPPTRAPCGSRTRLASLEDWDLSRSAKGANSWDAGTRTPTSWLTARLATVYNTPQ